jgi:hypothetical protein
MDEKTKPRIWPWLLVILPLWLIASGVFALVKYFDDEKTTKIEADKRFARNVSTESVADDLRKIISVIGERNTAKPDSLSATASMIEGALGPSNTGYSVSSIDGPSDFPILKVSVPSRKGSAAPIWILTSYDSPLGSAGAERNATGLSATLSAAQALADFPPSHPIHFLFLPHANQVDGPTLETADLVAKLIRADAQPRAILCIEAMGDAETLILSSRDTTTLPTVEFSDLGKILGAEIVCLGDDFDLSSTLFEMNLPAIRIATRPMLLPDETDEKTPFAPTLAASAGRLVELIKRLAQ